MFGTEAIWWLNSLLLAALTHAGVLWMLAFAEPENNEQPVKTRIVIETLPVAEDFSKPAIKAETKPIGDRVSPEQIDERETTKASSESDQITKVSAREQVVQNDPTGERLEKISNAGIAGVVRSNSAAERLENADNVLSPALGNIQANNASSVDRTAAPVQSERATQVIATVTDRAETVGETDRTLTLDRADRENLATTNTTPKRSVSVENTAKSVVAPSNPEVTTRVNTGDEPERIAVLRQKPTPVQTARPTESPTVETKTAVKSSDDRAKIVFNEKFVFPENTKRLAPASTRPSKTVAPQRIEAIENGGAAEQDKNSANTRASPQRLEQVAIANSSRAGRVEPDSRYRDLLRFLEQSEVEGCATILPTIANDGGVALSGFAADEGLWAGFQKSMTEELRVRLPLEAARIAKPQCRALTFAKTLPDYPRFSLGMRLDNANLVSGQSLDGTITDVRGRKVHLVVVDDEGLVQQIDGFLQPRVSSMSFSVAVSVRNQVVPTAQMLIALAVDRPLETVTSANQTLAEQFFAAVTEELAATNQRADIAIVSFYLRSAQNE